MSFRRRFDARFEVDQPDERTYGSVLRYLYRRVGVLVLLVAAPQFALHAYRGNWSFFLYAGGVGAAVSAAFVAVWRSGGTTAGTD